MPAILLYLLKVNIALLLFCLCYYAILRRLTFYTVNRVYLIIAILFSSLYPLLDFTLIMQRNPKLVQPIQVAVINLNIRAANFARPVAQTNYWEWLIALFWIGVAVMALRLAMQFLSLLKLYRRSKPALINNYKVRMIADESNPFSFWRSIYINPHHHGADDLQSIIAHEQVHVSQWHTLDILLAEISLVFYWFNPGVWLMKKAIAENLEFITDRKILLQGVDAKSYQYSLLYASFNTSPNAMVNHFNISTIKKRIMMMNSKRSSAYSLSRYGLIAPAVLVLVLVFGTTKAELMKKGAHAAKKATERAITAVTLTLNNNTINNKTASIVKEVKESTIKLTNYVSYTKKPDTTIKPIALNLTVDTPKNKLVKNTSISVPDSAIYIVNGTKWLSKAVMSQLDPTDIASIDIIDPTTSLKLFGSTPNRYIVLIITKKEKDSPLVTDLMQKLQEINNTKIKETDANYANTAKGSLDAINTSFTNNGSKQIQQPMIIKGASGTNDPLYIVDGKPIVGNVTKTLNILAIESITVFKDAATTAIYGEKGKNGVIIVTTKEGAKAKSKQRNNKN